MANVKTGKEQLKKELKKLSRSMDFVSKKFLADEKAAGKDFQIALTNSSLAVIARRSCHTELYYGYIH